MANVTIAKLSVTARAVINTSCDFAFFRYFSEIEIASIEKCPACPRQVMKHVKPSNVYVSSDTGIIARPYVELVLLKSINEVLLSSERFLENGVVDIPDNLKLKHKVESCADPERGTGGRIVLIKNLT